MNALLRCLDRVLTASEADHDFSGLDKLCDPVSIERIRCGWDGTYDIDRVEEVYSISDVDSRLCQGLRGVHLPPGVDLVSGFNRSKNNLQCLCELAFPGPYFTHEFEEKKPYISVNVRTKTGVIVAVLGAGYLKAEEEERMCYICSFQFYVFYAPSQQYHSRYGFNSIRCMAYALCYQLLFRCEQRFALHGGADTVLFSPDVLDRIKQRTISLSGEMLRRWGEAECRFSLDRDDVTLLNSFSGVRSLDVSRLWNPWSMDDKARTAFIERRRSDVQGEMKKLYDAFSMLFKVDWEDACMTIHLSPAVTCVLGWTIQVEDLPYPRVLYTLEDAMHDSQPTKRRMLIIYLLIDLVRRMKRFELADALEMLLYKPERWDLPSPTPPVLPADLVDVPGPVRLPENPRPGGPSIPDGHSRRPGGPNGRPGV
jgi:hypothetical protein